MIATALVVVSGGLAYAQTTGTSSTSTQGADTCIPVEHTSHDSFFSDGALRSDSEVLAAYDALDTTQKDQLKAACDADPTGSAGSAAGSTTGSGSTTGAASTTRSDGATTSGGTPAGSGTGAAASGTSCTASSMPYVASMQQLRAQIRCFWRHTH